MQRVNACDAWNEEAGGYGEASHAEQDIFVSAWSSSTRGLVGGRFGIALLLLAALEQGSKQACKPKSQDVTSSLYHT